MEDLVNEIGTFLDGGAAESDVIVFRTHGDDGEALLRVAASGYLLDRANRSAWLLSLRDGRPTLVDASTGTTALTGHQCADFLDILRECELTTYAQRPGVLLAGAETFHYVAPNGRHYRSFLRVGSMLNSLDDVDALCFWLAPRMKSAEVVLLDSSTILAAGLRSAEYAGRVWGAPALGVEALRHYDEEEVTLAARLRRFLDLNVTRPRLVFLESVCSTGALIDRVRDTCERIGFSVEPIPVFSTVSVAEARGVRPLCHVGAESEALTEPCVLCAAGSHRVTLLPSSYTLEVAADVRKTTIMKTDASRGRLYLDEYADATCVSLHRTEAESGRHHMIYIDGGELLESSRRFRMRLNRRLAELASPGGGILTPEHVAAVKLGVHAAARLGVPLLHLDEDGLPGSADDCSDLPPDWIASLRARPHLVLLDDVVVTGARLRRYLNALGGLFESVPDLQVTYVVGVARPEHREALSSIPRMLSGRGSFVAIETIVLPNWGEADCPWCHERDAVVDYEAAGGELAGALAERYDLLTNTERGLVDNEALLMWEGQTMHGLPHSIFGDGTQVQMFLSVAAAIQALRNDDALAEEFRPPIAQILHPVDTFNQRFFEYRLQLLILRACRPHDLNTRLVHRDLTETLRTRFAGDHDPHAREPCAVDPEVREQRSELILAAAHDKLPIEWLVRRGDDDAERRWIEHVLRDGDEDIAGFLQYLVNTPSRRRGGSRTSAT